MKAIRCENFGPPENLKLTDVPDPEPGKNEVLMEVKAAGAGYVDALLVQGLYQTKPQLPYIPGTEFCGVITEIGEDVRQYKIGDRVVASTLSGGFAERVAVPASACTPMPENMSYEEAAGFLINHCTALYGLKTCGGLKAGETVLVLGAAGGIGIAAVSVAKAMGAKVIAAASTQEKRNRCLESGADDTVDYLQDDWRRIVKQKSADNGVDVVYDPVGGDLTDPAFRSLARGGRYLVVGFASGVIPSLKLNLPLLKHCSIKGVDWGGFAFADPNNAAPYIAELSSWIADKRLLIAKPTIRPLSAAGPALRDMLDRKTLGKLIIVPDIN